MRMYACCVIFCVVFFILFKKWMCICYIWLYLLAHDTKRYIKHKKACALCSIQVRHFLLLPSARLFIHIALILYQTDIFVVVGIGDSECDMLLKYGGGCFIFANIYIQLHVSGYLDDNVKITYEQIHPPTNIDEITVSKCVLCIKYTYKYIIFCRSDW